MSNFSFECIELNLQTPTEYFGRFIFKTLPTGHGITLGNVLRRVLLTNLPGTTIVGARIAGVNHEFSTIPGVREDVLEILLNLKDLIFKSGSSVSSIGRLKVQGPCIVTADQLVLPTDVSLVNPTQYIATISEKINFELEVKIESGTGYLLSENRLKESHYPNDFLSIDAIFMPVRKVLYHVETIETDDNQGAEQLILDIWTNGSITPTKAVSIAAKQISNWLSPILNIEQQTNLSSSISLKEENLNNTLDHNETSVSSTIDLTNEENIFRTIPIEELNLSARAYNSLKRAQILMIDDLLQYSLQDLSEIKNFGQKSLEEVIEVLQNKYGVSLQ